MIDKLTEEQRKVLVIWGFLGLFLAILLIIFASNKNKYKSEYKIDKDYQIVEDYSRYYTITKIIDKYYTAINDNNYSSIMNMLDTNYIKKNDLRVDNVKNLYNYDKKISFKGSLMCSKRFDKGLTSYYVSGSTIAENVLKEYGNVYYEVILNENEMTFSINVIDVDTFGGVCRG